ncbi:uncharacterized protein LOC130854933 [Hippopotamus amphibius kiboko]|uniref:uncharacterized protein LOC130854933 n=1 Tax=Hippopotamus amphibius kiboko TaxID=575201 RepID=UPI00259364ED|nr:uncharacterized protein LOC130854933 [Hippopotamus amphibius kiboko]
MRPRRYRRSSPSAIAEQEGAPASPRSGGLRSPNHRLRIPGSRNRSPLGVGVLEGAFVGLSGRAGTTAPTIPRACPAPSPVPRWRFPIAPGYISRQPWRFSPPPSRDSWRTGRQLAEAFGCLPGAVPPAAALRPLQSRWWQELHGPLCLAVESRCATHPVQATPPGSALVLSRPRPPTAGARTPAVAAPHPEHGLHLLRRFPPRGIVKGRIFDTRHAAVMTALQMWRTSEPSSECSAYNDVQDEGRYHEWLPQYNDPAAPCALKCHARGQNFIVELVPEVLDGACGNADSLDMCVSDICQAVGCDPRLGSNAKEDSCGVSAADGATCRLGRGHSQSQASPEERPESSKGRTVNGHQSPQRAAWGAEQPRDRSGALLVGSGEAAAGVQRGCSRGQSPGRGLAPGQAGERRAKPRLHAWCRRCPPRHCWGRGRLLSAAELGNEPRRR